MNLHKQNFVCWPSVGPQDIKETYIRTYMHTYQIEEDRFFRSEVEVFFLPFCVSLDLVSELSQCVLW